jgi:hypothetical protein
MRYLLFLFSLLLSVSTAFAQTEKAPVVTKLPGEENLSLRERAERDFLMPVRRKKAVVAEAPKTIGEEVTSAPENDATAHAAVSTDEVRSEEVAAPVREARVVHATRHSSSRSAARRARLREEARAEARAEARRAAKRHAARSHSKAKSSAHSKATKKKSSSSAKSKKKATATKHKSSKKRR